MAYFSGLGAGKGWLKFQFLVEPAILRDILAATKSVSVITNRRVPRDYRSTPLNEYVEAYSAYLEAMHKPSEMHWSLSDAVYSGLTISLNHFVPKACPDNRFKLMNPQVPVVNLGPLSLYYDTRRGQLCTNVMSKLYFGMELSYPNVISLDRDGHEYLYETAELPNHALFQDLKTRIKKVTRPCKVKSSAKEHRTSIRITEGMRELMRDHPGLRAENLSVL